MNGIIYLGNANPFRLEEKAVSFSVWISRQSFKVTPIVFGLGGSGTRWCVRYNYRKDENLTLLFRRFAYFSMWNAKMPSHILLFENFRSLETYILQFTSGTWRTHTHTHILIKWEKPSNSIEVSGALDVSDTCLRKWNTRSICHSNDWFSLPRKWENLGNAFIEKWRLNNNAFYNNAFLGKFRKCIILLGKLMLFQTIEEWTMNYCFFCLKAVDHWNLLQIIDEEFK